MFEFDMAWYGFLNVNYFRFVSKDDAHCLVSMTAVDVDGIRSVGSN